MDKLVNSSEITLIFCYNCKSRCTGYRATNWKKICVICSCNRDDHFLTTNSEDSTTLDFFSTSISCKFSWIPSGLTPIQVEKYMNALPDDRIPIINSSGEHYRNVQILRQLPIYDHHCLTSLTGNNEYTEKEIINIKDFYFWRKRDCSGQGRILFSTSKYDDQNGTNCFHCKRIISYDDVAISAWRIGPSYLFHVSCFVCTICNELLVDLIYFCLDNKLYCGRHHAEKRIPRCYGCDELIFNDECIFAEDFYWHKQHFVCHICGAYLNEKEYGLSKGAPNEISRIKNSKSLNILCENCIYSSQNVSHTSNPITNVLPPTSNVASPNKQNTDLFSNYYLSDNSNKNSFNIELNSSKKLTNSPLINEKFITESNLRNSFNKILLDQHTNNNRSIYKMSEEQVVYPNGLAPNNSYNQMIPEAATNNKNTGSKLLPDHESYSEVEKKISDKNPKTRKKKKQSSYLSDYEVDRRRKTNNHDSTRNNEENIKSVVLGRRNDVIFPDNQVKNYKSTHDDSVIPFKQIYHYDVSEKIPNHNYKSNKHKKDKCSIQ